MSIYQEKIKNLRLHHIPTERLFNHQASPRCDCKPVEVSPDEWGHKNAFERARGKLTCVRRNTITLMEYYD